MTFSVGYLEGGRRVFAQSVGVNHFERGTLICSIHRCFCLSVTFTVGYLEGGTPTVAPVVGGLFGDVRSGIG